ncbi:hypothetical protein C1645_773428 [Glomus cerebriforme]|uniref:MARVEL domain-containing protein n=1 Tax=Glomus cerebriforme TaxID=658196 RepID=A0A397T1K9_9GLOM|nr:hypothetical protein C1645_773428 [Glomus cerebriforme]
MIHKLLTIIRPLQFIILMIIIGLEIAQLVTFRSGMNQDFTKVTKSTSLLFPVSWSSYFEDMNVIHGIKVFYYIVIILTLFCPQFFWKRFNKASILYRDKYYEYFYLALWFTVSLSNLNPVFAGTILNCNDPRWDSYGYRCKLYITSEFFSCILTLTWIISTFVLLSYLRKHKDEMADRKIRRAESNNNQKSDDDDENV